MREPIILASRGAKWWVTPDYSSSSGRSLSLRRKHLGDFFYHALRVGAHVGSVWAFDPDFDGCLVKVTLFMTDDMREEFTRESGFALEAPPVVRPA